MGCPKAQSLGQLFSLYAQEISYIVSSYGFKFHMYADDVQIYFECTNSDSKSTLLKKCFEDIQLWASKNYLKLNQNKSKLMVISNKLSKFMLPSICHNQEEFMVELL